jgi:quercetin dioxygenase-like cupin family protein
MSIPDMTLFSAIRVLSRSVARSAGPSPRSRVFYAREWTKSRCACEGRTEKVWVVRPVSIQRRRISMKAIAHQDHPPEAWRPGVETRMLISAVNGAAQLCIFEQWVAPGAGAPTHRHTVEEVLTVCEGEAEMWIEEQRAIVPAGQSLIVPAGRNHGFRNSGASPLHIRAVLAAPIFEAIPDGATEPTRRWQAP